MILETMEEMQKLPAGERPALKEQLAIFATAEGWLSRRERYKPKEETEDDAGIRLLREMMADPAKVVDRLHANPTFREALAAKGWLEPPARPRHRPSKKAVAHRKAYDERVTELTDQASGAEDGELRRRLDQAAGAKH